MYRNIYRIIFTILGVLIFAALAYGHDSSETILIENAQIFDGKSKGLLKNSSVLIEKNIIKQIGLNIEVPENTQIIDAKGATLTPGFIGTHEHLMLQITPSEGLTEDTRYFAYVGASVAETYLMNGWTSVRDASGNSFSLKRAIEKNIVIGPRIFPSGAMLSQTSGHSDSRLNSNPSSFSQGRPHNLQLYGDLVVADGEAEVLKATREQLRLGATQIKIAVGGGTASPSDPLDVIEFTDKEIRAAVQAAEDFQTYVMAHVYNPAGIRRVIENGVKCIEHGNMIDRETMQLMIDNDIWLSSQIMGFLPESLGGLTPEAIAKLEHATEKLDDLFKLVKEMNFEKLGFGTDIINSPGMIERINEEFTQRTKWFSNFEIMKQATYNSGQIVNMSNRFNPGKIGVIEEGALADILLIDGNPLNDISILTNPKENLLLIMKDGKIYKNITEL